MAWNGSQTTSPPSLPRDFPHLLAQGLSSAPPALSLTIMGKITTSARALGRQVGRALTFIERRVPPGLRSVLGVLLIAGGIVGFLPVLGFWMIPLGVAVLWLDLAALWRALRGMPRD